MRRAIPKKVLIVAAVGAAAFLLYRKVKPQGRVVRTPSAHAGWTHVWTPSGSYWEHKSGELAHSIEELGADIKRLLGG